ncbi:MAG TPA: glycosyltransferase family 39 protein [Ignavibacteria bacterium]|nr:glycosyltransferase family 39 protein [Ignavibacteria bacterium]HMR00739.1 glycosyltransferase family 39 protein [Ignavibacteria bacterium]
MKKIYIILLLAAIIRVIDISAPIIGWHSWRQSDTASIARNFYENGHNILYPMINWGGIGTGYVESEFQVYPFIVSILYAVFGFHDIFGRILSVFFSLLTVYGLYLLVRKIINDDTALWSALIYAILPLNIFYGRAFMPDAAMLMCSVYGIYFFSEWLDKNKLKYFFSAWIFIALAVLMKLPTLYIGLPLLYLAFHKYRWSLFKNLHLYSLAAMILLPAILWYYHAHQIFLNGGSSFGIWTYGQDKWGMFSLLIDPAWYNDIFFKSIAERHLTYPGFILFIWGLFIKRSSERARLFDIWLIAVLIFIFIAAQAHRAQEYYTLPFNIAAAVYIGKFLAKYLPLADFKAALSRYKYRSYFALLCIMLVCVLSYLRIARFYNGENQNSPVLKIGRDIQSVSNPQDKIITIGDGNPVYLYHAHRFGWTAMPEQMDSNYIAQRRKEGAKFITGEKIIFERNNSTDRLDFLLKNFKVIKNEADHFVVATE